MRRNGGAIERREARAEASAGERRSPYEAKRTARHVESTLDVELGVLAGQREVDEDRETAQSSW